MGAFAGIGSFVNDVLGGSTAGQTSQKYALKSMAQQNAYSKEAAQNAHQWEVQDLIKAGLNPALSAEGGGANMAGGSAISGHEQAGQLDLLGSITSAFKTTQDAKLAKEKGLTEGTQRILNIANSDLSKEQKNLLIKQEALTEAETNTEKMLAELHFGQAQNERIKYAINQVTLANNQTDFKAKMLYLEKLAEEMKFESNPTYVALKKSFELVGVATGALGNVISGSSNTSRTYSTNESYSNNTSDVTIHSHSRH